MRVNFQPLLINIFDINSESNDCVMGKGLIVVHLLTNTWRLVTATKVEKHLAGMLLCLTFTDL